MAEATGSAAFAERMLHHRGAGVSPAESRIGVPPVRPEGSNREIEALRWGFEEATSRLPTDAELKVLQNTLDRERKRYAADEQLARDYLAVGESPRDENVPAAEHAAWSQVAALILNLSETITRN